MGNKFIRELAGYAEGLSIALDAQAIAKLTGASVEEIRTLITDGVGLMVAGFIADGKLIIELPDRATTIKQAEFAENYRIEACEQFGLDPETSTWEDINKVANDIIRTSKPYSVRTRRKAR